MSSHARTLPSTPEAAITASDFVMELADAWNLSDDLRDALLLVVGEAVSNAAGHGNGFDPDRQVFLSCAREGGELRVCVEDEGPGITAERVATADLPEDPLQVNGRGLYIIRSLADRVWLEAEGRRICAAWALNGQGQA